jgi:hypothetical protein
MSLDLPVSVFDIGVNEIDNDFDKILQAAWNAGSGAHSGQTEQVAEHEAKKNGPAHGVNMNGVEAHGSGILRRVSKTPAMLRMVTVSQVGQVVLDVLGGISSH